MEAQAHWALFGLKDFKGGKGKENRKEKKRMEMKRKERKTIIKSIYLDRKEMKGNLKIMFG